MPTTDQPPTPPQHAPSLFVRRPAHPAQARDIRHEVARYVQELGCSDDQVDAVTLAVGEAINNAVSYGQEGIGSEISLCCRLVPPRALTVEVRNSGTGFLPDLSKAGVLPDEFAVHGRGFALMTMLMDDVQVFAEGGETVVRLVKRLAA